MSSIGITTTVPAEVLLAAGYKIIDLNNIFIGAAEYAKYVDIAERDGFPKSSCAWTKGIYGVCIKEGIKDIVGVLEGDCSNTKALAGVLKAHGVKVHPFNFPGSHKLYDIRFSINSLMRDFGVSIVDAEAVRQQLSGVRKLARRIDELTYIDGKASGFENHIYQVMLSDFNGDVNEFERMLADKVKEIESRKRAPENDNILRIGYIGVPPMTCDIYEFVEAMNAKIVYNEVQREFAFPRADQAYDIYEQYYDYTYPYNVEFRIDEIKKQIDIRRLDGIIHYTQAFCYKAIEDIIIKKKLDIPVLTIEGDKLNKLDSRTKLRIEAFIDMLSDQKGVVVK